jgi:hypothetical protein
MGSKMTTKSFVELFELEIQEGKEIFTVKKGKVWYGVINAGNRLYLTECSFDSALQAANKARALKKTNKIEARIIQQPKIEEKVDIKPETLKKPKITSSKRKIVGVNTELYSEEEMSSLASTGLKFREVWVVRDRKSGKFVHKSLKGNSVAEYCEDKEHAEIHTSFENAVSLVKTLNSVVGPGHELRRYWVKNSQ